MLKRIILFLLIYFPAFCVAQNIRLIGHLVDQADKPIAYASVSLFKTADSALVAGALSSQNGGFELRGLKAGQYYFKIRFLGYSNKIITGISLGKSQSTDLGKLVMLPDQKLLNEVNVTGQKDDITNKIDKQVYRAGQFGAARGGTAVDVIKNMPSVSINSQGEITMRGSSGFLVLINGKVVQGDLETILNQLPANAIENIELITSPSAKYDADGKGGIINITTYKGADNGLIIAVNAQGGLPPVHDYNNVINPVRFGGDATIDYKVNRWDLSAGGSYLRNDIAGQREGEVNTTVLNRYTTFPSFGERSFRRSNYAFRGSVTFAADAQNTLTAGLYIGGRTQYRLANLTYNNTKTDLNTGNTIGKIIYYNSNVVKRQGDFTLADLDYNHLFQDKSSLTFSGSFEYDLLEGFTHNRNLNYPDTTTLQQYTANINTNPLHGYRLQADYSVPIGPGKLETGYLFKFQKQNGMFLTQQQTFVSGPLLTLSDNFTDVKNTVQGAYAQYAGKSGQLQYSGGLRYEYSTRNFSANQAQYLNDLYLSNLFPSANLLYTFKSGFKIKAGYSRRIQRTNFNELNPYPEREHSETEELGDPNLLPEFVGLTEAGFIKDFKQGSVFVTFYHQGIQNAINRVNKVLTDTILYRIYTNAGKASLWGAETGSDIKINKWWTLYLGVNAYNYQIDGALFDNAVVVNNSSFNYAVNGNTGFKVSKNGLLQFNINYLSARATAQGQDSRFVTPNASFRETFFKGLVSATLQWQNIDLGLLHTNQQRITTSGSNFYTSTNYIQETDLFLLNISFNINQLSKKSKLPVSEFGDKEF